MCLGLVSGFASVNSVGGLKQVASSPDCERGSVRRGGELAYAVQHSLTDIGGCSFGVVLHQSREFFGQGIVEAVLIVPRRGGQKHQAVTVGGFVSEALTGLEDEQQQVGVGVRAGGADEVAGVLGVGDGVVDGVDIEFIAAAELNDGQMQPSGVAAVFGEALLDVRAEQDRRTLLKHSAGVVPGCCRDPALQQIGDARIVAQPVEDRVAAVLVDGVEHTVRVGDEGGGFGPQLTNLCQGLPVFRMVGEGGDGVGFAGASRLLLPACDQVGEAGARWACEPTGQALTLGFR